MRGCWPWNYVDNIPLRCWRVSGWAVCCDDPHLTLKERERERADLRPCSTSHFLVTQLTKAPAWHGCDLIAWIVLCHPLESWQKSSTDMCTWCHSVRTQYLSYVIHGGLKLTDICRIIVFFPFILLKHGSLFTFSHCVQRECVFNYQIRFFAQVFIPSARDSSVWLPLINAQQGLSREMAELSLSLMHMREQEQDFIKLHIRTGAIKGSSLLLWSFDLYHGIHKQKLDAYCEYRAWPGSYEKHSGEMACLTGRLLPFYSRWLVSEMKCTCGILSTPHTV